MSNWYVVQVKAGREAITRRYIEKYVEPETYRAVFFPQRIVRKHRGGEWKDCKDTLFPGYLFVITNDPKVFSSQLRKTPVFTRLLGGEVGFSCLADREVAMLQAFSLGPADGSTQQDAATTVPQDPMNDYVLGMSQGIKEGSEVIILNGPLMDNTAYIRKIDRHKRLAYVEFELCGRTVVVKMGLELVAQRS